MTEDEYRTRARELYGDEDLDIDTDAKVSVGDDGVWVAAWVWVSKEGNDA